MTFSFLGPDPVDVQVNAALQRLLGGARPSEIEVEHVDIKEEPGRRQADGGVVPGRSQSESAARYLAREMACFANTPGGGALIVGIADDGVRIGTALDPEWLRHRLWELTDRRLTVSIREVDLAGTRLLVLLTHEAIEPIRVEGKVRWRVADHCVDVDPSSWHTGRLRRIGADWSAQPSGHRHEHASLVAIEIGRRYLRDSGDPRSLKLASATDEDFLRRLNVVDGSGRLTNAGSLLFVETPHVGIDYIRRLVPGADSTQRIEGRGPLLVQIWEVDSASQAANRVVHLAAGFAHGQLRVVAPRALREAIVNGVVHRDWTSPQPTAVEHVGDVVTVTSPGGFVGGVTPENIITHPAVPRYRSLAEAVGSLRLAEREGVGVDRMVAGMLAIGRPAPEITELPGPYVRVGLLGGDPDAEVVTLLSAISPDTVPSDVDLLLLLHHLTEHAWVDLSAAVPVLQRPPGEAATALGRLTAAQVDGEPVVVAVSGVPADQPPAYRVSDAARSRLRRRLVGLASPDARRATVLTWARARDRVSTTEAADLTGLSVPAANTLLSDLEADGEVAPGRDTRRGRGFYYVPTA